MIATTKSLRGFKYAEVLTNGNRFSRFTPIELKSEACLGLADLVDNGGVPDWLICDGSGEQKEGAFKTLSQKTPHKADLD